ncbi:hypothetical protein ETD86_36285 [Nonomuraea turkmeniaca]|uniref:Uncharacterized protein n=1 Tax=Nonomuraea turkmeniaca TaxID=103838 RepID=A0A5S4F5S0_9ACTN|nr:hypothetical protein [Nonomuraea turkmeniaca]TMR11289.1 hypothetical protein ETD86_36285 [Nonomuraea turkmeniaca]
MSTLAAAAVLLVAACAGPTAAVPDPPGWRWCAGANQPGFGAGLESRIIWVGSVLTTGPTTMTLTADGREVWLTAYAGQPS